MTSENKGMELDRKETVLVPFFSFKVNVSKFTSFLSWTGMSLSVLSIIGSLALLTIHMDVKPCMENFLNKLHPDLSENNASIDLYLYEGSSRMIFIMTIMTIIKFM